MAAVAGKDWWTIQQVARETGKHEFTIRRWIWDAKVKAVQDDAGRWHVDPKSLPQERVIEGVDRFTKDRIRVLEHDLREAQERCEVLEEQVSNLTRAVSNLTAKG